MNPVEIGTGKSFKGLAAYLLHDRGQAQSANRVAWAQSYNLLGAAPERAWRMMADTAMSAGRLKAAAGIKAGKKAVNTAYHFSLNFNPEDRPSEAVQRAAVESALKALGLDGHQALAVAHDDTPHRHVHVAVNLIDPETGLSAASKQPGGKPALLSNSQRKLSTWAKAFEREHGLTVTEGRLANEEKRQRGEKVEARREPRNVYERKRQEDRSPRLALVKQSFTAKAAELSQEGRDLAAEHRQQWERARIDHMARQNVAWMEQRKAQQALTDRMKEAYKPRWRALFVRQRSEAEDFARGEATVIGRLWHGMAVYKERAQHQDRLGGFLAAFSAEERKAIIERKHDHERESMALRFRHELRHESRELRRGYDEGRANQLTVYLTQRAALKSWQDRRHGALREAWAEHNAKRKAALVKGYARSQAPARSQAQDMGRGLYRDPEL